MRIPLALIVDDEELVRTGLATAMASSGYAVVVAPDAAAAIAVLGTHPIDLIVTDRAMPGDDGCALCRYVRSDASTARIPIVMYSAEDAPDAIACARAAGADAFVSKYSPFAALLDASEDARASRARERGRLGA